MAHSLLSGSGWPEGPARLRFDALTPSEQAVRVQAKTLARAASHCLEQEGWSIMESEREVTGNGDTGHLDILAWHGGDKLSAVVDLKTGQGIGAGWLQVGGYIQLLGDESGVWPAVEYGGILHVPRVAVSKEPKATLEVRHGDSLVQAWAVAKGRIDAVLAGATALRSPGQHCGRCVASCPVRV